MEPDLQPADYDASGYRVHVRELHEALYATIQATHHALASVQRWSSEACRAATQRGRAGGPADDRQHRAALALQADLTRMFQESHRLYVAVRTSMSDENARRLADQASRLLEVFSADQQCANAPCAPARSDLPADR